MSQATRRMLTDRVVVDLLVAAGVAVARRRRSRARVEMTAPPRGQVEVPGAFGGDAQAAEAAWPIFYDDQGRTHLLM